jgi:uncharacterized glyoxalase superfamily protein PhnB
MPVKTRKAAATATRKSSRKKTATRPAASPPASMPEALGGVIPYLLVDGASRAADFYARAFGAKEVFRYPEDEQGRTMHIHLYLNGGSLMLSDAYPEHGVPLEKPQAFTLHVQVGDVDAWWTRAVDAGCTVDLPLQKMFWGDRYGQVRCPFGVRWSIGAPDTE